MVPPASARKSPKPPKPPKAWQRAEAGRYRSADERFTLESDGAGRWFVTDAASLDEFGLARTTGPFPTLEAAKGAADEARSAPAAESPLAARLASARDRPAAPTSLTRSARRRGSTRVPGGATDGEPEGAGVATAAANDDTAAPRSRARRGAPPEPATSPAPTWIDELAGRDADAAKRAHSLVRALGREGVPDADALVRRDLLGDRPAIATRLLARDVLAAIAALRDPNPATLAEAVAGVLASSPRRDGLPGWELVEREGPAERRRSIRLTAADLLEAAQDGGTSEG